MNKKQKDSVYIKTFRKGVVSSLIPLLFMSLCVFIFTTSQSLQRLGAADQNVLAKDDQIITYMLEDLSRSMGNLAKDPTAVDFAMRPHLQDTGRNAALCAILENLATSYCYIDASYLFSSYEDLGLTSTGQVLFGIPEWISSFLDNHELFHTGIHYQITSPEDGTGEKLILSMGIPAYSADPVAVAILKIDLVDFLGSAVENNAANISGGDIFVLAETGEQLFSSSEREAAGIDMAHSQHSMEPVERESHLTWSGTGVLLHSAYENSELGWRYIKISPALSENNNPFPLVFPLVISVLAACLIGLLLAYQSSKELYHPLEQLIATLPEPAAETETSQNEYQRLADYYDKLLNQRAEVYEQVGAIKPLLVKKFLASLMNEKRIGPDEILYQTELLEIPFRHTYFRVFLVQIDRYYKMTYSDEEKRDMKLQMQALISAGTNDSIYNISAEVTDETLLVICNLQYEEPAEAAQQMIRAAAEEIKTEIEAAWPLTVTVGIGQICRLEELPVSCESAKTALAYKLYRGDGSIIDFEELQAVSRQARYYDVEKIQQLLNSVRTGDEKNTRRLLKEIFDEISDQEKFLPKQVWAIFQNLTAALENILLPGHLFEEAGVHENLEEELLKKKTLSDVENWLIDVCCRTAAAVKSNSSAKTQQHAERVKAYIDSNLTKDIALSSVSEYVNYSPTYVSKIFRQYYGISCIDYLNSCRVKLSQELLLADPSLSVKEIGFKVGFNNMQSFFRIFKRYTGMTPLQYREANER